MRFYKDPASNLSQSGPSVIKQFIAPTEFCDSEHEKIGVAVNNILKGCPDNESAVAKRLFYWVRDNIKYTLGLQSDTASQTLLKNEGSCSNKANLLAALLRAVGLPAGFHLMEVKTKLYFGPLCVQRIGKFLSEKSLHVYNAVFINGEWVSVDCSDDIRLSQSLRHLTPPATPIDFDGVNEAMLHINPDHIISNTLFPLVSLDHVFGKKPKLPAEILDFVNVYIDYLRNKCILASSVEEAEDQFFQWYRETRPLDFQKFVLFEAKLLKDLHKNIQEQPSVANNGKLS